MIKNKLFLPLIIWICWQRKFLNHIKFSFFSFLATFSDLMTKLGKTSSAYVNENCAVNGFGNLRAKPEACCMSRII